MHVEGCSGGQFELRDCTKPRARRNSECLVFENLLCFNSQYFKAKLQLRRKPVRGECELCHTVISPMHHLLEFCRDGCGQNFHVECLEEWQLGTHNVPVCSLCRPGRDNQSHDHDDCWNKRPPIPENGPFCPLCRIEWNTLPKPTCEKFYDKSARALDVYTYYLYHRGLACSAYFLVNKGPIELLILSCRLGARLIDDGFEDLAMEALTDKLKKNFAPTRYLIKLAYEVEDAAQAIFNEAALDWIQRNPEEYKANISQYPLAFVSEMSVAMLDGIVTAPSIEVARKVLRRPNNRIAVPDQ